MAETTLPTPTPEQEQRARWDLLLADLEQRRQQSRWETPKAVAMIAVAAALFGGFVIAGVNWLRPPVPAPQQITVHLDQPLKVQILPAPSSGRPQ